MAIRLFTNSTMFLCAESASVAQADGLRIPDLCDGGAIKLDSVADLESDDCTSSGLTGLRVDSLPSLGNTLAAEDSA